MKIVVATPPFFFVEENTILQTLFEEGMDMLHIRKPESEPIFCERLLTLMPNKWYQRIIVNDHFYLQNEYGLKGIDLDKRNDRYGYVVLDATPSEMQLAAERHKINHKVFARGVTTIDGLQFARDCGCGGVVLEDILWNRFDLHESNNFKELVDLFKFFRKAAD